MMRAFDFRFLPMPGGLLQQPESLMQDLVTISYLSQIVEQEVKQSEK